jgi:hypothetical protein
MLPLFRTVNELYYTVTTVLSLCRRFGRMFCRHLH